MSERVDLLHGAWAAVESGGAVGADKVHAGLSEEGVALRDPDREALRLRALEARVLEATAAAVAAVSVDRGRVTNVVIHKLAEGHHEHRETSPRDVRLPSESVGYLSAELNLTTSICQRWRKSLFPQFLQPSTISGR